MGGGGVAGGGGEGEREPLAVDVAHADDRVGETRLQRHAERLALLIVEHGLAAQLLAREPLRPNRHHSSGQLLLYLLLPPIALRHGIRGQRRCGKRHHRPGAVHRTCRRDAALAASPTATATTSSDSSVAPSGAAGPSGTGGGKTRSPRARPAPNGSPRPNGPLGSPGHGEIQKCKKPTPPLSAAASSR